MEGDKFLWVSKAESMEITEHALERIYQHCRRWLSKQNAYEIFQQATLLKPWQIAVLGYRPGYTWRLLQGIHSWYFRFTLNGEELVAVLSEGQTKGEFVWVTTYGRNRESDLRRMNQALSLIAA